MENAFLGFGNPLPHYYHFFPFPLFSCPKVCSVLQAVNNLEDSTLLQPSMPENAFLFPQNAQNISNFPKSTPSNIDYEVEQCQNEKKGWKEMKRISKEDYNPRQRMEKRKPSILRENRNVIPIKIRQMLSFLARQSKSQETIQKYVNNHGNRGEFNEKKFYAFLKKKTEKIRNYATLPNLQQFLSVECLQRDLHPLQQQKFYLEIVRVLLAYYLNNISLLCSLTSSRIRQEQKHQHVKAQRALLKFLKNTHYA